MNKKKILIICSIIICVFIGLSIYLVITINESKINEIKEKVFTYLNDQTNNEYASSMSIKLGLLNYNFDELNSNNVNIDFLMKTNFLLHSEMSDTNLNNIYKAKVGMTKSEYESQSNYLASKGINCYSNKGYNCDVICSKSNAYIIKFIKSKNTGVDNIGIEDIKKFCVKNAQYPLFTNESVIDLLTLKELFKNITGIELNYNSSVTSDEYYKYNAYILKDYQRLSDNIKEIKEIEDIKIKGKKINVSYIALTDSLNELKGTVTLEEKNETYIIISNSINTSYSLQ